MTTAYDRLQEEPRIDVNRGDLAPEERSQLRTISIRGSPGYSRTNTPGAYTSVYYIEGDEKRAVERFVEENREVLEQIDFSKNRNSLQGAVSREIYDWILHEMGVRKIEKFETVVLETRPDGTQWVIDREKYDRFPNRRYTAGESGSARLPPDGSLTDIYESFDQIITESDLAETEIEGDVRQVLDYYRVAPEFHCQPITTDDSELAIKKRITSKRLVIPREFARTYQNNEHPWQTVRNYRRVHALAAADPDRSAASIAREVGISESQAWSWLNETKPHPVRGLETAESKGWINVTEDDPVFRRLNIMVAWIYSGGGIAKETFVPSFSVGDESHIQVLNHAFDVIGTEYRVIDRSDSGSGIEVRPTKNGAVLGRILSTLGAPVGQKANQEQIQLPDYLSNVSPEHRHDFASVYLLNRGVPLAQAVSSRWTEIGEIRSEQYLRELRDFFRDISGERVDYDANNNKIFLSDETVRVIAENKEFNELFQ